MESNWELNPAMKHRNRFESVNLDVVLVAPNAKPPVARIMDYGKHRFEQQKKEKEARKNQKVNQFEGSSFKSYN